MNPLLLLLDDLEAKAKAATPGPYYSYPFILFAGKDAIASATDHTTKATFEYIAACSPEAVLALITALREAAEFYSILECEPVFGFEVNTTSLTKKARAFLAKYFPRGEHERR